MASGFVNELGNAVLRVPMPVDQLLIPFRLLDRVQILALDILDQGQLGGGRLVDLADDRRDRVQPGALRRAPAALAGDDLIALAVAVRPQQDRLEHAALGNRIGEFVDRILAELDSRLIGVGANAPDLDLAYAAAALRLLVRRRRRVGVAEQRRKPPPQAPARPIVAHAATATWGSRPIN